MDRQYLYCSSSLLYTKVIRGHYQIALSELLHLSYRLPDLQLYPNATWLETIFSFDKSKERLVSISFRTCPPWFLSRKQSWYISYQSNDLDSLEKIIYLHWWVLADSANFDLYLLLLPRTINPMVTLILLISTAISIQIPKIVGQLTAKRRTTYLEKQKRLLSDIGGSRTSLV